MDDQLIFGSCITNAGGFAYVEVRLVQCLFVAFPNIATHVSIPWAVFVLPCGYSGGQLLVRQSLASL